VPRRERACRAARIRPSGAGRSGAPRAACRGPAPALLPPPRESPGSGATTRAVVSERARTPGGESESAGRAQRLKRQPVRAGRRPPRSGALEEASTSGTLSPPLGVRPGPRRQRRLGTSAQSALNRPKSDSASVTPANSELAANQNNRPCSGFGSSSASSRFTRERSQVRNPPRPSSSKGPLGCRACFEHCPVHSIAVASRYVRAALAPGPSTSRISGDPVRLASPAGRSSLPQPAIRRARAPAGWRRGAARARQPPSSGRCRRASPASAAERSPVRAPRGCRPCAGPAA
jgi:hypothetical protein